MFSCCEKNSSSAHSEINYEASVPPIANHNPLPLRPQPAPPRKGILHHFHRGLRNHKATQTLSTVQSQPIQTATQTLPPLMPCQRSTISLHKLQKQSQLLTSLWNSKQKEGYCRHQHTRCTELVDSKPIMNLPVGSFHFNDLPPLPPLKLSFPVIPTQPQPVTAISTLFREVQSEYKQEEPTSKKIRNTPNRRLIFQERDTIISRYADDPSEAEIRVEESTIYQHDNMLAPTGEVILGPDWVLYQTKDPENGQLLSVKEISVTHMAEIAREVNLCQQVEERGGGELILGLKGSHINQGKYQLIKEYFSQSVKSLLRTIGNPTSLTHQISTLLSSLLEKGFYLTSMPRLDDFVIFRQRVVLQGMTVLGQDSSEAMNEEEALLLLRQEMLEVLL